MLINPLVVSIDIRRTEGGRYAIAVVSHDDEGMPVERSCRTVSRLNIAVVQASVMAIEMMSCRKVTRPAGD